MNFSKKQDCPHWAADRLAHPIQTENGVVLLGHQSHVEKEHYEFLARHLPVQITGDPSERIEVSNYKDLPRIETNRIRNGVCLVMGEGIAQKAKKLWKALPVN